MKVRIELKSIYLTMLPLLNNLNNLVKSDTEPKRCRKAGCKNLIANACYLLSHSCDSCVCTCLLLCSTATKVTSIHAGIAKNDTEATEVTVVAPIESDLIQEASSLSRDEKHHHEGI